MRTTEMVIGAANILQQILLILCSKSQEERRRKTRGDVPCLPSTEQTRVDIWGFSPVPVSQTMTLTPRGATLELSLMLDACWQVQLRGKVVKISKKYEEARWTWPVSSHTRSYTTWAQWQGSGQSASRQGVWVSLAGHQKSSTKKTQSILHPLSHFSLKPVLFT